MPTLPKETEWLRADVTGKIVGVDRKNQVIRGFIVAQAGPFKTPGRGEFDKDALKEIVRLTKAAPNGLKSRFAHPSLSGDGVGKFLGRVRDPWLDRITMRDSGGELKSNKIDVVRGDLHLDPTSRNTPSGDLGGYIMDLAESDADALSSSLVLKTDMEYRTDKKGRPLKDDDDNELPPLWRPTRLHASDIVDSGDAVDGLLGAQNGLSIGGLPDAVIRQASVLLDRQFGDASAEVIRARCNAWLDRYLAERFGEAEEGEDGKGQDNRVAADIGRRAIERAARLRDEVVTG
jgi:hypothetical protein